MAGLSVSLAGPKINHSYTASRSLPGFALLSANGMQEATPSQQRASLETCLFALAAYGQA